MNWKEYFDELGAGSIRNVYLFTGPEEFVKREALQKLRAAILPMGLEALNETVMEGAAAERIVEACETLPMMCDRRLVVVRDWAPLMAGKSRDEENETGRILDWIARKNNECTLVFYMRQDADSRKKLASTLTKSGNTVVFDPLGDADISRWVSSRLKPLKKKMSAAAVQRLVFTAGRELTRLDGELSKLAAYSGDRSAIDEADIEAVVSPSLEYGAFDMLNHLFDGDAQGAYRLLNLMLQHGTNRVVMIASIARQLRGMSFLARAIENGQSAEETGRQLALNPYAAKVMAQKARRYAASALEELYIAAIDTDHAIKSGQMRDSAALDRLFIKISTMQPKSMQPVQRGLRQR